jgi:hypothetical protein
MPISEDEVKSAAAYVLFYKRVKGEDTAISNGTYRFYNASHR